MSKIDNSLYSRQLYAIGKDAMEKINKSSVLIHGMSGLGVEIAKCVILTGVNSVTLCDSGKIKQKELSSNYYAKSEDIGKYRVEVVKNKLASLNPYVQVNTQLSSQLSEDDISSHNVIVVCDTLFMKQIASNNIARKHGTKFIMANTFGVMGSIFCDFGDEFSVNDIDGEPVKSGVITEINENKVVCDEPHQLYVGDYVDIINSYCETFNKVNKIHDSTTFSIEHGFENSKESTLTFRQCKIPVKMEFKSLEKSIHDPEFTNVLTSDFNRQKFLHDFNIALNMFLSTNKKFPNNSTDVATLMNTIKYTDEYKEICEKMCYTCCGKICPVDSIIGSIVAQEVTKAISKKFTPIKQWMHIDFCGILPDIETLRNMSNKYEKTRYESQVKIIGKHMQQEIENAKIFIVGAGAIGCELLKNLAMMGIENIYITDMDKIEKSNLNRQFLFRNNNIGQYKSEAAKEAILEMNPDVNIVAHTNKIDADTLTIYDNQFYDELTCVLTALDNIQARLFVDKMCVENCCSLIDSGTLGTKGNVQVVIPHITESYGSSYDPPEKSIPMCTLKYFPYLIEHCIQFGRNLFEGTFVKAPENFMMYKKNPEKFKTMNPTERAEIIDDIIFVAENAVFHSKECIRFAFKMWHEQFRDQIHHLLKKFPLDATTSEGQCFWTGTKKFPKIYDIDDTDINIDFLEATSNLWADVFGYEHVTRNQILLFLQNAKSPEISQISGEIITDEKKKEDVNTDKYENNLEKIPDADSLFFDVKPLEFEKDDESNFHIEFMAGSSNLRAKNYNIQTVDKFEVKRIAGKIIPALVTTTSLVSGLACIEMIKSMMDDDKKIENYTNSFINLGVSFFGFSEPTECKKHKIGSYEYSMWDNLTFPNVRLREILKTIKAKTDVEVSTVYAGDCTLYSDTLNNTKKEKRLNMCIGDIYKEVSKKDIPDIFTIEVYMDVNDDSDPITCKIQC